MDMSEEMSTSISDLQNKNLGQQVEYELDNYNENYDNYNTNTYNDNSQVIPQATLQKAPPMRQGYSDNFKTHQVINDNMYYPRDQYLNEVPVNNTQVEEKSDNYMTFNGIFSNLYDRIKEPIIITILFVILAHRLVARNINIYLPFSGQSPSTDIVSLITRGFILSVVFLMLKKYT